jgi:HlyD family secretion protein
MHPNPKKIAPILLLIVVTAAVVWYFSVGRGTKANGVLASSGTIEATRLNVSPEIGGRVAEVLAREGDIVQAGQVLARLDDTLFQAQLAQAQAQLELAQANYDLVAMGVPVEQRAQAVAKAELEQLAAQQNLQTLDETADLAAARTQQEIAQAEKALDQANKRLDSLNTASDPVDIDAARAAVVLAKDKLDKARQDFKPYEKKPEDNLIRANFQARLAEVQKRYDLVVERLNNLLGETNVLDLDIVEADQAVLEAQLADAQRRYEEVKNSPDPDAVALAQARLEAATASLAAAKAAPPPEQLALAQAQVNAAQAAVDVILAQIQKLELTAPFNGTVINRSVEPGEMALPAAPLLSLANLSDLRITIYLPEDRYGEVNLGDEVDVTVDSFPGERFAAEVIQIADEAEFTPRNVQTAEGRKTTVFAIQLAVENRDGKLKPGMPADVTFK